MRIHRLHLRHFRGVTDREVTFPSSGVVILQGQNEVGKSTMIEAFDLLLDKADSSKAAAVRAVQPAGQDVGPEVEAEISTGDYRFTYTKQWLRSPRTELHLSAPQRRHLTGGQAHDEVRRILEETLDTALFKALRVLQTGARAPVDLSDSAALSAALDRSAGSAGHDDQGEALLQRVDQEYARYFTPTGRPTGELARIEQDKRTREEAFTAAEQGLAQLQQDVDLHARLTAELADIDRSRAEATQRAEADEKAWQQVQQLREQLAEADRSVQLHRSERDLHAGAAQRRTDQERQLAAKQEALAQLATESAQLQEQLQEATGAYDRARAEVDAARVAEQERRHEVDRAGRAVELHHDRAEARRLGELLATVEAQQQVIEECHTQLAGARIDTELLERIDAAAQQETISRAKHESAAARVHLEALAGLEVLIDGEARPLQVEESLDLPVTGQVRLEVPELLRVSVAPATSTESTETELAAAEQELRELLQAAGAAGRGDAHRQFERDEQVRTRLRHAEEHLQQLLAERTVGQLRAEHAELVARLEPDPGSTQKPQAGSGAAEPGPGAQAEQGPGAEAEAGPGASADTGPGQDLAELRAAKQAAEAAHTRARERTSAAEQELAQAGGWHSSLREEVTRLDARHAGMAEDIADRQQVLEREREEISDEHLQERSDSAAQALAQAEEAVAEVRGRLEGIATEQVEAARRNSQQLLERLGTEREELAERVREMTASLRVRGRQGLQEEYDTTRSQLELARTDHEELRRRADACDLLHTELHRARDAARAHYVRPFRDQVLSLGRVVYGPGFDVEIGEDLQIRTRTLDGVTIDFEMLSAGAQEQLGIITRLACAAVVDPQQGVPVIIDDALGYSDPGRLAAMNTMIGALSSDAQIILLTCTPERYRAIGSATVVRVEAESAAHPTGLSG